jgi:hypothetical protein
MQGDTSIKIFVQDDREILVVVVHLGPKALNGHLPAYFDNLRLLANLSRNYGRFVAHQIAVTYVALNRVCLARVAALLYPISHNVKERTTMDETMAKLIELINGIFR